MKDPPTFFTSVAGNRTIRSDGIAGSKDHRNIRTYFDSVNEELDEALKDTRIKWIEIERTSPIATKTIRRDRPNSRGERSGGRLPSRDSLRTDKTR